MKPAPALVSLLQVRTDVLYNNLTFFELVSTAGNLKRLFTEKYTAKHLRILANNDRILKRTTLLAINYHDSNKFALFSLLPI